MQHEGIGVSVGVKSRIAQVEQMFSALSSTADIHQGDSYVSFGGGGRRSGHPWDRRNPHKPRHHKLIAQFPDLLIAL
jgi:hypothetical protein